MAFKLNSSFLVIALQGVIAAAVDDNDKEITEAVASALTIKEADHRRLCQAAGIKDEQTVKSLSKKRTAMAAAMADYLSSIIKEGVRRKT